MTSRDPFGYDDARIVIKGLRTVVVDQGDGFAYVQESAWYVRDPRLSTSLASPVVRDEPRRPTDADAHVGEKYCLACGEWKSESEFSPDKRNKTGRHSYCKACRSRFGRAKYRAQRRAGRINASSAPSPRS